MYDDLLHLAHAADLQTATLPVNTIMKSMYDDLLHLAHAAQLQTATLPVNTWRVCMMISFISLMRLTCKQPLCQSTHEEYVWSPSSRSCGSPAKHASTLCQINTWRVRRISFISLMRLTYKTRIHSLPVQFKMVSMCSGRPICAPPCLSGVYPMLPWNTVPINLKSMYDDVLHLAHAAHLQMSTLCHANQLIQHRKNMFTLKKKKSKTQRTASVQQNKSKHTRG